ncbi:hypothetical protein [Streptomyces sp. NPDC051909]|uniref:hypothetical protein n=1 Tax=Streptomyces sp. NPDC051909 TaxID=3154944 RepID=UPI003435CC2D
MLSTRTALLAGLALVGVLLVGCEPSADSPRATVSSPSTSPSVSPSNSPGVSPDGGPTAGPDDEYGWQSYVGGLPGPEHGTVTRAGVSLARQAAGYRFYLWETSKNEVCTAQVEESVRQAREVVCGDAEEAAPAKGSRLARLAGPGTGFAEWYVMIAADPGAKVAGIAHEGKALSWRYVRTLGPGTTGRDVYYVTLPEETYGWLDVALTSADGRPVKDRLRL